MMMASNNSRLIALILFPFNPTFLSFHGICNIKLLIDCCFVICIVDGILLLVAMFLVHFFYGFRVLFILGLDTKLLREFIGNDHMYWNLIWKLIYVLNLQYILYWCLKISWQFFIFLFLFLKVNIHLINFKFIHYSYWMCVPSDYF